jgi:predicted HTH domain antitoxin
MTVTTYTSRELRESRFLEDQSVSIVTSHGKPVKVAIPFDARTFHEGIEKAIALYFVENHILTQAKAAKIAGLSLSTFLQLMAKYGISAVDQSEAELREELEQFQ